MTAQTRTPIRHRIARLHLVMGILAVLLASLASRLVVLATTDSSTLSATADTRIIRTERIDGRRGMIADRKGEPLAVSVNTFDLWVYKPNIEDVKSLSRSLADALNLSASSIETLLSQPRPLYVSVARRVPLESYNVCRAVPSRAITLEPSFKRSHPYGPLACHIVGFTDNDGRGLEGVELLYNDELNPTPGQRRYLRDNLGRRISDPSSDSVIPSKDGQTIRLTINADIQNIVEEELSRVIDAYDPSSATAIVMDPYTADILAIANFPAFNPDDRNGTDIEQYRNRAITDQYEPGSTFKSFTLSLALDKGAITPDSPLINLENGRWQVGQRTLKDSHPPKEPFYPPWRVLAESSNIGASKIALMAYGGLTIRQLVNIRGEDRLERQLKRIMLSDSAWEYYADLRAFGFGEPTGIDFPGESSGAVRAPQDWNRDSLMSIPMGQEIATTPIQIIRGYSALINGGRVLKPHIVLERRTETGDCLYQRKVEELSQPIRKETSDKIRTMLRQVVTETQLKKIDDKELQLAGKTGTAQIARNGHYESGKYIGSFCGFAPYHEPKLIALVVVREPDRKKGYYGSTVAAPAVARILKRALNAR
ncbi:MAG: penicillin-binding protein 2 [Planctomycetota bacterium]